MLKTTNTIKIRYNRFKSDTRFETKPVKTFNFEKGLKSIDIKEEWFINKSSSSNEEVYDMVANMFFRYLDNDYSFLNDFLGDELIFDFKAERLLRILRLTQNSKFNVNDLQTIIKFNHYEKKELHFFVKKSRDNYTLLLIDLYHLGIYADKKENNKIMQIPLEKIYKSKRHNQYCLEEMLKLK